MKKRIVILSTLSLMLAFGLASCNDVVELGGITIEGIDANIDSSAQSMSFTVENDVKAFDLSKIKSDGAKIKALDKNGNDLGEELNLNEGKNEFTIVFELEGVEFSYKLSITRNAPKEATLEKISVKTLNLSYAVNDAFKNGKLLLTYSDSSTKEVDLTLEMVSGFNTATPGKKTLSISYEGKTTSVDINVYERVYEVTKFKSKYLKGEEFSNGELTIKLGSDIKVVEITPDMVSGFKTTELGKASVTISYDGHEIKKDIEVVDRILEIKEFKTSYLKDEEFSNGILIIRAENEEKEIEITKDMLEGFTTQSTGEILVRLTYLGDVIEIKVNVYADDNSQYKALLRDILVRYQAYSIIQSEKPSLSLDEVFLEYYESLKLEIPDEIVEEAFKELKKINLTYDQLLKINDVLINEAYYINDFMLKVQDIDNPWPEIALKADLALVDAIKGALCKASDILSIEQLSLLLPIDEGNDIKLGFILNGEEVFKSLTEISKMIGIDELSTLFERLDSLQREGLDKSLASSVIINLMKALGEINSNSVMDLLNVIRSEDEILPNIAINKAAVILEELYNNLDLDKLSALAMDALRLIPLNGLTAKAKLNDIALAMSNLSKYIPSLIDYMKSISMDDLNAIISVININNSGINDTTLRSLIHLSKSLNSLLTLMSEDNDLILSLNKVFTSNGIEALSFKAIFDEWINLSRTEVKQEAYTEDEMMGILMPLLQVIIAQPKLTVDMAEEIIVPKGTALLDFISLLNKNAYISYINEAGDNASYEFSEASFNLDEVNRDLALRGYHELTIRINENDVIIPYYVIDNELLLADLETVKACLNSTILVDKKTNNPLGVLYLKGNSDLISLDDFVNSFNGRSVSYYLEDLGYTNWITVNVSKYELIEGNDGFGGLKITMPEGSYILPIQIKVVDLDKLSITDVHVNDKTLDNKISASSSGNDLYLDLNIGITIKRCIDDIHQEDLIPGELELSVEFLGKNLSFKLNVLNDEEGFMLKTIKVDSLYKGAPEKTLFSSLTKAIIISNGNDIAGVTGDELEYGLLNEYGAKSIDVSILSENEETTVYKLEGKDLAGKVIFTFEIEANNMSESNYLNAFKIELDIDKQIEIKISKEEFIELKNNNFAVIDKYLMDELNAIPFNITSYVNGVESFPSLGQYIQDNNIDYDISIEYLKEDYIILSIYTLNYGFNIKVLDKSKASKDIKLISAEKTNTIYNFNCTLNQDSLEISRDEALNAIGNMYSFVFLVDDLEVVLTGDKLSEFVNQNKNIAFNYFTTELHMSFEFQNAFSFNGDFYINPGKNLNLKQVASSIAIDNIELLDNIDVLKSIRNQDLAFSFNSFSGEELTTYYDEYIESVNVLGYKEENNQYLIDLDIEFLLSHYTISVVADKLPIDKNPYFIIQDELIVDDINNISFDDLRKIIIPSYDRYTVLGYDYKAKYPSFSYKCSVLDERTVFVELYNGSDIITADTVDINDLKNHHYTEYLLTFSDNQSIRYDEVLYLEEESQAYLEKFIRKSLETVDIFNYDQLEYGYGYLLSIDDFYKDFKLKITDNHNHTYTIDLIKNDGGYVYDSIIINTASKRTDPNRIRVDYEIISIDKFDLDVIANTISQIIIRDFDGNIIAINDKEGIKDILSKALVKVLPDHYMIYISIGGAKAELKFWKGYDAQILPNSGVAAIKSDVVITEVNRENVINAIESISYRDANGTNLVVESKEKINNLLEGTYFIYDSENKTFRFVYDDSTLIAGALS